MKINPRYYLYSILTFLMVPAVWAKQCSSSDGNTLEFVFCSLSNFWGEWPAKYPGAFLKTALFAVIMTVLYLGASVAFRNAEKKHIGIISACLSILSIANRIFR